MNERIHGGGTLLAILEQGFDKHTTVNGLPIFRPAKILYVFLLYWNLTRCHSLLVQGNIYELYIFKN